MKHSSPPSSSPVEQRVADGMRILWDVPIPMEDGVVLRADVFLPTKVGRYAVIMSYGPYGKGVTFQDKSEIGWYSLAWERMVTDYPEILEGSSNKYQNWEAVDPEKWVPDGFVCVRVDSRGAGRSPGVFDPTSSPREIRDYYNCIEWAAVQEWSNGKIGLNGISYYATNQWQVAALQPPHLAAICVWEGAADRYRDGSRHGGIYTQFSKIWFDLQVLPLQHGYGGHDVRSKFTGERVTGPETLTDAELEANRRLPWAEEALHRVLEDDYYHERTADLSRITVPLLSAGNWGGMGLHTRGNFEGFLGAGSKEKWLRVHGDTHYSPFYRNEGVELQKRFFGHFLQGKDTGWEHQPRVQLHVRSPGERFDVRDEQEWPMARTKWTRFYLDPESRTLGSSPHTGAPITYDTTGDGVTFSLPPAEVDMEITGPVAARLIVSSETADADLFLALRLFAPDGNEVLFMGSNDPHVPIGLGWLRASHRKLDPERTLPYRPYHTHDELQPLVPGQPVVLDIEILPTSIVVPAGYALKFNVRGKDYDHQLGDSGSSDAPHAMTGIGPFVHTHPQDRPMEIFGKKITLHFEEGREPFVMLPVIPAKPS
jgi:predicted acyl esterase